MMDVKFPDVPFVRSVLHPTDFSDSSDNAFRHALALSVRRESMLTLLHVVSDASDLHSWNEFPAVRQTLERWGLLEADADRSAVTTELGVDVEKLNLRNRDVLSAVLDYIQHHSTDLIVLSTDGRKGLPRWIRGSVAEKLARTSRTMTLFVPREARGFVDDATGALNLRRILVPVDHRPDSRAALAYASRVARHSNTGPVEVSLLHVGPAEAFPSTETPEVPGCQWARIQREGDVLPAIIESADELDADRRA